MATFHTNNTMDDVFYDVDEQPVASSSGRTWSEARNADKLRAGKVQELIGTELSRLDAEEYLTEMTVHLRRMEDETLPDVNLIDTQREIQWFMRPYLMDFIIEAHNTFHLMPETLFLTINLLDRYCSRRVVYKKHYQLVACAALLIAAKYTDKKDRVPQIVELNHMCCGMYDAAMFTMWEMHLLNTLEWTIGHPTVDYFTKLIVSEERDDSEVEHMAAYLCEIALYHRDFVSTKPSVMARASLALARAILARPEVNDPQWGHAESVTLLALSRHLHAPSIVLSKKFSSPNYSNVSRTLTDFMLQQAAISQRQQQATAAVPEPLPTPTVEAAETANLCATPHAKSSARAFEGGYMTPPITPDTSQVPARTTWR